MMKKKIKNKKLIGIERLRQEMKAGFRRMDRRFEQVDKRFDGIDKRNKEADKRFNEFRDFVVQHMLIKEEADEKFATKEDLQQFKSDIMLVSDKIVGDFQHFQQELTMISYKVGGISKLEYRVDVIEARLEGRILKKVTFD